MHGIISKDKWLGTKLLTLPGCLDKEFPVVGRGLKKKKGKTVNVSKVKIEDLCPFCFKPIVFKSKEQHDKWCFLSEQMRKSNFNVTQYEKSLLKMYPTALFKNALAMRTVDEDDSFKSFIFNEKYNTTEAEYNKKKACKKRKERNRRIGK